MEFTWGYLVAFLGGTIVGPLFVELIKKRLNPVHIPKPDLHFNNFSTEKIPDRVLRLKVDVINNGDAPAHIEEIRILGTVKRDSVTVPTTAEPKTITVSLPCKPVDEGEELKVFITGSNKPFIFRVPRVRIP